LENDGGDLTMGSGTVGLTQFGFKNLEQDRTAMFGPGGRKRAGKWVWIGIAGGATALLLLGGVFWALTRNPSSKPLQASPIQAEESFDTPYAPLLDDAPEEGESIYSGLEESTTPTTPPVTEAADLPPFPEVVEKPPTPAPPEPTSLDADGYATVSPVQQNPIKPPPSNPVDPAAALVQQVQQGKWPNSPAARLSLADQLNDFHKVAEANKAYAKALESGSINRKEKIHAYGGLAVTFKNMGMKNDALNAVQQLLDLDPGNRFANKLKSELN
jgi:tetratricopeptide (TPR) repeat protein